MILGITGNIGSGKSTAAQLFADHGYTYINADIVGHTLYREKQIKEEIVSMFGEDILTDGEIDRKKLKVIVFNDATELKRLNAMMHPLILKKIEEMIKNTKGNVAIEAALLIEANWKCYDKLLLITVDKDNQFDRVFKKGKYTDKEIRTIIESQGDQDQKVKHADFIIDNSQSKEEFISSVEDLIASL